MSGLSLYGSGLTITEAQGPNYYLGTWNASTNTPTLASSTAPAGPAGSYYIVSVAGTTTLNGISDWTVGDWAIWNGSVWQKLEGGATAITIGSTAIAGGTSGRVLYDNAGALGEYTVTGTAGSVVLSASPALTGTPTFAGSSSGTTGLTASAAASGTLTLPAATDTLVGKATTDTLTNKTLTSPVITGTTWANIPAAGTAGKMVFVSNAGTKGSMWLDDGTRWKPTNGYAVLASLDSVSSNVANSETIVFQYQIPAGLWQTGDIIRINYSQEKSGTTDTAALVIRCGTAGTTSDTQLSGSSANIAAANRFNSGYVEYRLNSATSAQQTATLGGVGSASSALPAIAISSASANALYISVSIYSSGATDTVALRSAMLQIFSKAN